MRLNGLRAFRYVYELGSISAAAERQNLSQPAVSRLLSGLEERLDMPLFFRRGRRLVPTPEGERFYAQTHRLLASIDDLPRIAKDIREGGNMRIRLLTMPRLANALALPVIADLHKKLPNVEFQIDIIPRRDMESELSRLDYDFAIATLPITGTVASIEPVNVQRLYVVVARDHPLAKRGTVGPRELINENIIGLPSHTRHRQEMDDIFSSFSTTPKVVATVSSIDAAIRLAASGMGVTLADGIMRATAVGQDCRLVPLTPARNVTYAIIRPPINTAHHGSELIEEALRDRFAKLPE